MKGFGVGIVRWLLGLVFGIVAAVILFGLAARVTSVGGSLSELGPLALLMAGFGIAFFPAVFAAGTRSPRHVARRGLIGIAVEGLIALVLGGYQLIARSALVPSTAFSWLDAAQSTLASVANVFTSDLLVTLIGLILLIVGVLLAFALRTPSAASAPAAPSRAVAAPAPSSAATTRAPAIARPQPAQPAAGGQATPAAPTKAVPPSTDDEDAKLMADLDALRKRLPKMGIDEPGSGGKS